MRRATVIISAVILAIIAASSLPQAQTPACGTFVARWGSYCNLSTGEGCIDPDGDGPQELGDGQFGNTYAIAVDPSGNVYAADLLNNRIQKFDANGNFLTKWYGPPALPGSAFIGMGADGAGNVYAAHVGFGNYRLLKYDSSGNLLTAWGNTCLLFDPRLIGCWDIDGEGPLEFGDGQFGAPFGVEVDRAGNVYVAEGHNRRVQKFDSNGRFLTKWGTKCDLSTGEGCVDPDGDGPLELGDGQFAGPMDVAVDGAGNVYVLDRYEDLADPSVFSRVQKFDANGNFLGKWGGITRRPRHIASDEAGNIFVGSNFGYVQVFDRSGTLLVRFPAAQGIGGLAVARGGNLYHANADIQIFSCALERQISIDIKPGSEPNSINLGSSGVIPVAILSEAEFDAPALVDPDTISLAGARVKLVGKSRRFLCHTEDVNADALPDLVCQVETAQFMIEEGASQATLEAATYQGRPLRGQDSVRIVPD